MNKPRFNTEKLSVFIKVVGIFIAILLPCLIYSGRSYYHYYYQLIGVEHILQMPDQLEVIYKGFLNILTITEELRKNIIIWVMVIEIISLVVIYPYIKRSVRKYASVNLFKHYMNIVSQYFFLVLIIFIIVSRIYNILFDVRIVSQNIAQNAFNYIVYSIQDDRTYSTGNEVASDSRYVVIYSYKNFAFYAINKDEYIKNNSYDFTKYRKFSLSCNKQIDIKNQYSKFFIHQPDCSNQWHYRQDSVNVIKEKS